MLSSTISDSVAIFSALTKSRPWPAWTSRPALRRKRSAARDPGELGLGCGAVARRQSVAPGAGVDLDDRRADRDSGFDLRRLGGDEQRHANAGLGQPSHRRAQRLALPGGIEAAFGRALLPPLGNEAGGMRANLARDLHHFAASPPFRD